MATRKKDRLKPTKLLVTYEAIDAHGCDGVNPVVRLHVSHPTNRKAKLMIEVSEDCLLLVLPRFRTVSGPSSENVLIAIPE